MRRLIAVFKDQCPALCLFPKPSSAQSSGKILSNKLEKCSVLFIAQLPAVKAVCISASISRGETCKKPGLMLPSTASTLGKMDGALQYALWSLLWVLLCTAMKVWENCATGLIISSRTFLQFASTEPPRHGQKMYPRLWSGWSLVSSLVYRLSKYRIVAL